MLALKSTERPETLRVVEADGTEKTVLRCATLKAPIRTRAASFPDESLHLKGLETMRVAILDDFHHAYEQTAGVRRLRERAEVKIYTDPFGHPSVLRGFDAIVATRERTKFDRRLLEQLPDLRIISQTGNHAY